MYVNIVCELRSFLLPIPLVEQQKEFPKGRYFFVGERNAPRWRARQVFLIGRVLSLIGKEETR